MNGRVFTSKRERPEAGHPMHEFTVTVHASLDSRPPLWAAIVKVLHVVESLDHGAVKIGCFAW